MGFCLRPWPPVCNYADRRRRSSFTPLVDISLMSSAPCNTYQGPNLSCLKTATTTKAEYHRAVPTKSKAPMNNSVIIALALLYLFIYLKRRSTKRLPLPPGPPADPLFGHLRLMPSENHELTFHEWSKKYGISHYQHVQFHLYPHKCEWFCQAMSSISEFWDAT